MARAEGEIAAVRSAMDEPRNPAELMMTESEFFWVRLVALRVSCSKQLTIEHNPMEGTAVTVDTNGPVSVRSLDDIAELRQRQLESSSKPNTVEAERLSALDHPRCLFMTGSWIGLVESAYGEETQSAQGLSARRHGFDSIALAAGRLADARTTPDRLRLALKCAPVQGL
jgi:hypothetical protein